MEFKFWRPHLFVSNGTWNGKGKYILLKLSLKVRSDREFQRSAQINIEHRRLEVSIGIMTTEILPTRNTFCSISHKLKVFLGDKSDIMRKDIKVNQFILLWRSDDCSLVFYPRNLKICDWTDTYLKKIPTKKLVFQQDRDSCHRKDGNTK